MGIRRSFKAMCRRKEHAHETSTRGTTTIKFGVLKPNIEWTVKAILIPNA